MNENTAGLYYEPETTEHGYEKRADGKWYPKAELEVAVATCGTPWIKPPGGVCGNVGDVDGQHMNDGVQANQGVGNVGEYEFKPGQWLPPGKHVGDVDSKEKGSAARYNKGKPPMEYIPLEQQMLVWRGREAYTNKIRFIFEALSEFEKGRGEMGEVMDVLHPQDLIDASYVWAHGAKKYSAWNWAKGMAWSIPLACISRHMTAILTGEELDDESGLRHWAHIVCNILMLDHYSRYYLEGDDRPPREIFNNVG